MLESWVKVFLLPLYLCYRSTQSIRAMSSTLESALIIFQQNDYVTGMLIISSRRSELQSYHSFYSHFCWIWSRWAIGSISIQCINFSVVSPHIFGWGINLLLCMILSLLLTIYAGRIYLGWPCFLSKQGRSDQIPDQTLDLGVDHVHSCMHWVDSYDL